MSNSTNPQGQTLINPNNHSPARDVTQQWEIMARDWLSTLPEGRILIPADVEGWLQSNHADLPDQIKTMPRPDLYQLFTSIHTSIEPHTVVLL